MTGGVPEPVLRLRIRVRGVVQGVGFRPHVWREATRLGLAGWVENDAAGVSIEVAGPAAALAEFRRSVETGPPSARVEGVEVEPSPDGPDGAGQSFAILDSHRSGGAPSGIPADMATCPACLAEVHDPADRRHGHPFATCADCGPRFTLVERLPWDRPRTAMRDFEPCAACAREYADPADRRFHAETIACPDCGPVAWFVAAPGADPDRPPAAAPRGAAALALAGRRLRGGAILAVKGVGGFHLVCDAAHAAAVETLRRRKARPAKPLALLAASVEACRRFARVPPAAARLLESPARPIVLLECLADAALAPGIAPGIDRVGVMLPAFPLHSLLLGDPRSAEGFAALVMTSGNRADEPICHTNAAAAARLGPLADGFLLHDRRIVAPCDDSVVRVAAGEVLPLRRARGYAPLPVPLGGDGPTVLALGADLKSAACVAVGPRAWMTQHVGDMGALESLEALEAAVGHLLALLGVRPAIVAADLHPGYHSGRLAAALAARFGAALERVGHHEAHAAAVMADRRAADPGASGGDALVAAFDGTGFLPGPSGPIVAGGEWFRVTGEPSAPAIAHVASLAPFALSGGDAAVRRPWRVALSLVRQAGIPWDDRLPPVAAVGAAAATLRGQLDAGIGCLPCTSLGRLFDGVASLVGACQENTHEGEAAMALEALAAGAGGTRTYAFAVPARIAAGAAPAAIGWHGLVRDVVADVRAGVPAAAIARGFHDAVARMIAEVARAVSPGAGLAVGLTGGVFQNATLVEGAFAALAAAGHEPFCHRIVPPNDGGLALGQALVARSRAARGVTSPARAS